MENTVGFFTMLYNLIVNGFKALPNLFNIFLKMPFLLQEILLMAFFVVVMPRLFDLVVKLKDYKLKLDNSL